MIGNLRELFGSSATISLGNSKSPYNSNNIVQLSAGKELSCYSDSIKRVDVLRIAKQLMRVPCQVDVLWNSVLVSTPTTALFISVASAYESWDDVVSRRHRHKVKKMVVSNYATGQGFAVFFPSAWFGEAKVNHLLDECHLTDDLKMWWFISTHESD